MLHIELKEWIDSNLMVFSEKRNKKILINKRLLNPYLEKINSLDKRDLIFDLTSFLPIERKLQERIFCILNDISSAPKCRHKDCSNIVRLGCSNDGFGYGFHCSYKCAQNNLETKEKLRLTNLERHGTEFPLQSEICKNKSKLSNLKNYGVENISQSQVIKDKKRDKSLEKYGTENVLQSKIVQDKIKQIHLERCGFDNPQKSPEISQKTTRTRKLTTFKRYHKSERFNSVEILFNFEEFLTDRFLKFSCKKCESIYFGRIRQAYPPRCPDCFPKITTKSHYEDDIKNYIQTFYDGEIKLNSKPLDGKEIDIFIPDLNVGFEFNGIFWHSEQNGGKDSIYHLNKSKVAEKYGIKLLHIYEDHWNDCEEIIKSKIKSMLGFHDNVAKIDNCEIKEVSYTHSVKFLEENAITFIEPLVSFGLYFKKKLVQLLIVDENNEIEFHDRKFTNIQNGHYKLFNHLLENTDHSQFEIFQDINFENIPSQIYKDLNFQLSEIIPPTFDFVTKGFRVEESNIGNYEKIDKLWNCGKVKYLFNR